MSEYASPQDPPMLLTRTIFQSPTIIALLHTRLRSALKEDVVFVGERSIELLEYVAERRSLQRVAIKTDFSSRIRSASLIQSWGTDEDQLGPLNTMDTRSDYPSTSKSQILVLAMEDAKLMLLRVKERDPGSVVFVTHTEPFPAGSPLRQAGRMIASDPHSRAIAVAAPDNTLILYQIEHATTGQTSLDSLFKATMVLPTNMSCLRMAFLRPPEDDKKALMLVLLGKEGNHMVSRMYLWNQDSALRPHNIRTISRKLGKEHGIPIMLIPSKVPAHFVLLCDLSIAIYRLHTDGNAEQTACAPLCRPMSRDDRWQDSHLGNSIGKPMWINWARPLRDSLGGKDAFYLGREDGKLKYVILKIGNSKLSVIDQLDAATLPCDTSSGFVILDEPSLFRTGSRSPPMESDVFVCAGQVSDGGVVEVAVPDLYENGGCAHQMIQSISSWAPIRAGVVIPPNDILNPDPSLQQRLILAMGQEPYGSLGELRFGIEAHMTLMSSLEVDLKGANDLWMFEGVDNLRPNALVSYPFKSLWCMIEKMSVTSMVSNHPNYDDSAYSVDGPTLSAARIEFASEDTSTHEARKFCAVLRISSTSIEIVVSDDDGHPTVSQAWPIESACTASIDSRRRLAITAGTRDGDNHFAIHQVEYKEGQFRLSPVSTGTLEDSEPTCVTYLNTNDDDQPMDPKRFDIPLVVLGCRDGSLHVWCTSKLGKSHSVFMGATTIDSNDAGASIHSVAAFRIRDDVSKGAFICMGARNGELLIITRLDDPVSIAKNTRSRIGQDAVRLIRHPERLNAVVAWSGNAMCIVEPQIQEHDPHTSAILFTNTSSTHSVPRNIDAISFADKSTDMPTEILVISESSLFLGPLGCQEKAVPQRRRISGTPTHLLYIAESKMLVVGSICNYVDDKAHKRIAISTLCLVDPAKPNFGIDAHGLGSATFELDPGERLTALLWLDLKDARGKVHYYIVAASKVGSTQPANGDGKLEERGSVRWLQIIGTSYAEYQIVCAKRSEEKDVIHALCYMGPGWIVMSCGLSLIERKWVEGEKKWSRKFLHRFPSPAICLSKNETYWPPVLHASTESHSILIFAFTLADRGEDCPCRLVGSHADIAAGLTHFWLDSTQEYLVSSKPGIVACFTDPHNLRETGGQVRIKSTIQIEFPSSVIQFVKANITPAWKGRREHCQPGEVEGNILGLATDGTVYAVTSLSEAGWRLLRFVLVICMRDERISPERPRRMPKQIVEEPLTSVAARDRHVDGNVLLRLVERKDALEVLSDMLSKESADRIPLPLLGAPDDMVIMPSMSRRRTPPEPMGCVPSTSKEILKFLIRLLENPF